MKHKLNIYLFAFITILLQSCTTNQITAEMASSEYDTFNCEELHKESKELEKKYKNSRQSLLEIKEMWSHGDNDYLRMHRITDTWKKNAKAIKVRLISIRDIINHKCSQTSSAYFLHKDAKKIRSPKVDITGNWSGTWISTDGKNGGKSTATFLQDKNNLIGLFSIEDSPCLKSGSIKGMVLGSDVKMDITSGTHTIVFNANSISNRSINGSYVTTSGKCQGSKGSVVLISKI